MQYFHQEGGGRTPGTPYEIHHYQHVSDDVGWSHHVRISLWTQSITVNSSSASLLLNIFLSFEVGIAQPNGNFK